ncbi:MAG TPA: type VI secretion system tube protein Hcp [Polyangiaceae bacterium]|nr:type VI secretion system tube protein Hcp [Polyangiaceae bacterium]
MTRIRLLGVVGISLMAMTLGAAGTADAQNIPQTATTATVASQGNNAPTGARAAAFLKIDGIDGESQDSGHKNWIELSSFTLGVTHAGSAQGTGAASERANVSEIHITKKQDKSSNALALALSNGTHFKTVIIEMRKAGGDPLNAKYYRITLTNALVSSHSFSSAGGGAVPTESMTLNFTKISFEYAQQKADGSPGQYQPVQEGYDVKTNVRM